MKATALRVVVLVLAVTLFSTQDSPAQSIVFSLDIGSDLEMSDPASPGPIDPGDVYAAPYRGGDSPLKDDEVIFNGDPPPPPAVPVGSGTIDDYTNYFDLDGEDQLGSVYITEGPPYPLFAVDATNVSCLWKEPFQIYISYEDDGAPSWIANDIPVLVPPSHGTLPLYDEVLTGTTWRSWSLLGTADEDALGLSADPPDEENDDDVDALDVELCQYYYWTCDHEACGDGSTIALDPGCIYMTDKSVPGVYMPAIPQVTLGLTNNPSTTITEDADVDAFEFCTTDDADILNAFKGTTAGTQYLAVVFSVDADDPATPNTDESGGLNPNTLYISLLTGDPPFPLITFDEDVDALAFYETSEETPPEEPPVWCPKWIQPPDCQWGLDTTSWRLRESSHSASRHVADDWWCDGRPIVGLKWWGSYIGWMTNDPGTNVAPPAGLQPMGFHVTWYTDIPATNDGFSKPGGVLFTNYYPLELDPAQTDIVAGIVIEQNWCVSELDYIGANTWEHEYQYTLLFPDKDTWNEKEGTVYWVSIEAVYSTAPADYPWGWKTTTPDWHWNDDAVFGRHGEEWFEMFYPPEDWGWITNHPYEGESADLAFVLLSDVCPQRCKKWEQPPDMIEGEDMFSSAFWDQGVLVDKVRADDFISDGRPITDIHWWGSYSNWQIDVQGFDTNPVLPPTGTGEPVGFNLSWHLNADPDCDVGPLLTNLYVSISNCHEVFYGSVEQFWKGPGYFEHEYQYYVDLLDPEITGGGAWLETNTGHYWLNIQAVFATNWSPGIQHGGWGWKITPAITECPSRISGNGGVLWQDAVLPVGHPRAGQPFDLAFELTTTNIPWKSNQLDKVRITNNWNNTALTRHYLVSSGYCGCGRQLLQEATSMLQNTWTDLQTNDYPRPENTWWVQPLDTQRFYRIKQIP